VDRMELIAFVQDMVDGSASAEAIVDAVIAALTPDDGDECPVCGVCP
jgi:hypothetical protein